MASAGEDVYCTVRSPEHVLTYELLTLSARLKRLLLARLERATEPLSYPTKLMPDVSTGAAVLAHSLRDAGTSKKLAVLVTLDTLSAATIGELKARSHSSKMSQKQCSSGRAGTIRPCHSRRPHREP